MDRSKIAALCHDLCDPDLLIHPLDHHLLVDALILTPDKIAIEILVHIVHGLDVWQRLIDKNIIDIEGVLWKFHPCGTKQLCAINGGVHQKILRLTEFSYILPAENVSLREHVLIVHRMAGVILHMLIDIIADHQIQRCPRRVELAQLVHDAAQRIGIQPVI